MKVKLFKPRRGKKVSKAGLPGSHKLLLASLQFYRQHRRTLWPVALVALAVSLLLGVGGGNDGQALAQSLWFVFTSCALIWTVRHSQDAHSQPSLTQAMYIGTAPAIKFLLVLMVLSLATVPFSTGLLLYVVIGSITAGAPSFIDQLIGVGLWSVFALASLYLLGRLLVGLIIVTLPELRPMAALRLSWRLSHHHALALCGRLLVFCLYSVVLITPFSLLVGSTGWLATLGQLSIQVVAGLVVLPLLYIYVFKIYQHLQ